MRGGHLQTLLGYWARRHLRWTLPAEDLVVDLDGGVRLLLRASWQQAREARPTLVLVHGLGGDDRSTYSVATGSVAWGLGWNVVRMNMRGAGESEAVCARLYHAGVDTDLVAVHFFSGRLRSVVHAVLPLAEARRAHEMMEASQHFGKIVLRV